MIEELNPLNIKFSINSPLSPEECEKNKKKFFSSREEDSKKSCWIFQNCKVIIKFHEDVLENFETTMNLFHKESDRTVTMSDDFDSDYIKKMVFFFYCKKIEEIQLEHIFKLLKVAIFLQVEFVIYEIIEFLKKNLTNIFIVSFIRKNAYDLFSYFKQDGKNILENLIGECEKYLIQKKHFKEYLKQFKKDFFDKMPAFIEDIFYSSTKLLKDFKAPDETIVDLIFLFKDALIDYKTKRNENFDRKKYFHEILNKSFPLRETVEFYLSKLTGDKTNLDKTNLEKVDFKMNLKVKLMEAQVNIKELKEETKSLKSSLEKITQKQEKFEEIIKELSGKNETTEISTKKRKKIDLVTNKKINVFLSNHFPKFIGKKKLLINLENGDKSIINKKVRNKKNVVIFLEARDNDLIFGAFYSISMPSITSTSDEEYFKDDNSYIFEVKSNQICEANKNEDKHLKTNPDCFYMFGSSAKNNNGIYCDYNSISYGGEKTQQYLGDNTFGFQSRTKSSLKNIFIYQLTEK